MSSGTGMQGLPCPECRSHSNVPIQYGFPSTEMTEAHERGEIELGGCVVMGGLPTQFCRICGHYWGRLGDIWPALDDPVPSPRDAPEVGEG